MAYDAEKFDLGSSRDHAPTTCAATRDPIARAAPVDPLTLTTPRERLEYLRDFLRELARDKFNMTLFFSRNDGMCSLDSSADVGECGTAACIGGWAVTLFHERPVPQYVDGSSGHISALAAELLGISRSVGSDLFFPGSVYDDVTGDIVLDGYVASPAQAADVLDHLLNTGKVDWSVARSEA